MKHKIMPVIDIDDLEQAIEIQFGKEVLAHYEIRQLLFYDEYMNDCCIRYYFGDDVKYHGYRWEDENDISIRNLINQFLRDEFPGQTDILIDVSW